MDAAKILIVDDEKFVRRTISRVLSSEGFATFEASNGPDALRMAQEQSFDLMLLDIVMDGMDGFQVIRTLRDLGILLPVFVLSGRQADNDKILALGIGADDYITKPFSLSVLRARVNTQLRKAESLQAHTSASVYKKGCYEFNFERMIFLVDGQEIELSKTEQRLLRLLVQNEGINLRRDFLLDRVWNDSAEFVDANALSVSVKRLRDKLGTPDSIKTVYGIGYRFE